MTEKKTMLEKLEQRKKKLDAEIRKAKAAQAKKQATLLSEKARIVGAALLLECESNPALKSTITPLIEKHTTSAKDRKTYGLSSLSKK